MHHVVNLLRGEHGACLHLRHGDAQSHIVGSGREPRNLRLVHTLSAILDVRLCVVLAGWRKARDDGAHGGAAVLHSVVVHQHDPRPYAMLARFKLDEALRGSRLTLPSLRPFPDIKVFVNTKKVGQLSEGKSRDKKRAAEIIRRSMGVSGSFLGVAGAWPRQRRNSPDSDDHAQEPSRHSTS